MVNKLMITFLGFDFLFFGMAGLILAFSVMSEKENRSAPTLDNVAKELLLAQCPLTGKKIPNLGRNGTGGEGGSGQRRISIRKRQKKNIRVPRQHPILARSEIVEGQKITSVPL